MNSMIRRETYLDWNATVPVRPEAAAAIAAALRDCGNASSVHRWGRTARQRIEGAREAVAALVGADPDGVGVVTVNDSRGAGARELCTEARIDQ